jgi:hypothetical protein
VHQQEAVAIGLELAESWLVVAAAEAREILETLGEIGHDPLAGGDRDRRDKLRPTILRCESGTESAGAFEAVELVLEDEKGAGASLAPEHGGDR